MGHLCSAFSDAGGSGTRRHIQQVRIFVNCQHDVIPRSIGSAQFLRPVSDCLAVCLRVVALTRPSTSSRAASRPSAPSDSRPCASLVRICLLSLSARACVPFAMDLCLITRPIGFVLAGGLRLLTQKLRLCCSELRVFLWVILLAACRRDVRGDRLRDHARGPLRHRAAGRELADDRAAEVSLFPSDNPAFLPCCLPVCQTVFTCSSLETSSVAHDPLTVVCVPVRFAMEPSSSQLAGHSSLTVALCLCSLLPIARFGCERLLAVGDPKQVRAFSRFILFACAVPASACRITALHSWRLLTSRSISAAADAGDAAEPQTGHHEGC